MLKETKNHIFNLNKIENDKNYLYLKPSLDYLNNCRNKKNLNFLDWTATVPIIPPKNNILNKGKKLFSKKNISRHSKFKGEPVLIKEIVNYFQSSNIKCNNENIIVRQSIFNILEEIYKLVDNKNLEILIPTPAFGFYVSQCQLFNIKTQLLPAKEKNNWKITPEQLNKKLKNNKNIKILLFNNPVNPTGVVYTENEIKALGKILKKYKILIICDEVFKDLILNKNLKYYSFVCIKELKKQTIVLNGVGKTRGLSGLGVSFAYAPKWICEEFHKNKYLSIANVSAQLVATEALKNNKKNKKYLNETIKKHLSNIFFIKKQIKLLNQEISRVLHNNKEYVNLLIENTDATSVIVLSFKKLKGKKINTHKINTGLDLAKIFKNIINLAMVPGEAFFMKADDILLRMPTSYKKKEIKEGFERMKECFRKLT